MKKFVFFYILIGLFLSPLSAQETTTFFNETFGSPTTTSSTSVTDYKGWSKTDVTYSGSARVSNTSTYVCGLDGSSKDGYLYFNSSSYVDFYVAGLNTEDYEDVYLTFNLMKSVAKSVTFAVSYSTDGVDGTFTTLEVPSENSSSWQTVTSSSTLPSVSSLCLKIEHTTESSGSNYRLFIDDLQLYGTEKAAETNAVAPEFSPESGTTFFDSLTITATTTTDNAVIYYTVDGTDPDNSSDVFPEDGLTIKQTTTVKAIAVADGLESSEIVTASYTKIGLAFDEEEYSVMVGDTVTLTAKSSYTSDVTYASSDETIAVVDASSGKVTAVSEGTVVITASTTDDDGNTITATCTLTVNATTSVYLKGDYALVSYLSNYGYYAMCSSDESDPGDRLDAKAVNVVNSKVIYTDTINSLIKWTIDEEEGTLMSSDGQYAAYLNESSNPTYIGMSDDVYNWYCNGTDGYYYTSEEEERVLVAHYTTGCVFSAYSATTALRTPQRIAVAMPFALGYRRTVTSGNYGTICLPYAVASDDMKGAEFYSPVGKVVKDDVVTGVVLEQVDALESGMPYVYYATGDTILVAYSGEESETAGTNNGLIGTFSRIESIEEGMYMISDNELKKVSSAGGGLYAHRAYFNLNEMSEYTEDETSEANVRILLLTDDGATGIIPIETQESEGLVDVYNLCGMRVRSRVPLSDATTGLEKGIYIINGQKKIVR